MADTETTLFHYCSTQTFHSIISGSNIRLSSMVHSNDSEEGIWTLKLIRKACMAIATVGPAAKGFNAWHVARAMEEIDRLRDILDGLGLCFSEKGDMLSQWRGYADDGNGFSLGFNEIRLKSWCKANPGVKLAQVIYDEARALEGLQELAAKIENHAMDGAFNSPVPSLLGAAGMSDSELEEYKKKVSSAYNGFSFDMGIYLLDHLFRFKNPAFEEELEWRLLTSIVPSSEIYDVYAGRNVLKPFRTFHLHDENGKSIITKVVIGPKNTTPIPVVKQFLNRNEFHNVEVSKSASTYR